jgi:DNA helicase-2/ATP-dependent DNA helicase PcrA
VRTRREQRGPDLKEYFTDTSPNYEDLSQEPFIASRGSLVVHEAFGKGRVVAVDGAGENARAIVDFESVGRKHLMLKYAHLRSG